MGVTKGSFYWHFPGRESLLERALLRWEEHDERNLSKSLGEIDHPRDRLVSFFRRVGREKLTHEVYSELCAAAGHPQVEPVLERVAEVTGRVVSWFTLAIVLVTFTVVVLRYAFNLGWIAMQESILYFHSAVFLLGSAYTLKRGGHVRVDIFYRDMGPRARAWVDLLGVLLLLLPVCVFILWVSWDYVAVSWSLLEGSREAGGLPAVFVLKSAIPLMAVFMILQGIAQLARSLGVLLGGQGGD